MTEKPDKGPALRSANPFLPKEAPKPTKKATPAASVKPSVVSEDIKQCPFCAEDIKAAAVLCKHCGKSLEPQPRPEPKPAKPTGDPLDRMVQNSPEITPNQWLVFFGVFIVGVCMVLSMGGKSEPTSSEKERLALIAAAAERAGTSSATYEDGRRDGLEAGRAIRNTQKYGNSQIDGIVDPVVARRRGEIYGPGQAYGDGWVAGCKDGMRQ